MDDRQDHTVALLSRDEELARRAGDAVAAAGLRLAVVDSAAPEQWRRARALLIGEDALETLRRYGVSRSREAVVVGLDGREGPLWRAAGDMPVAGAVGLPAGGAWLVHWLRGLPGAGSSVDGVVAALFSAAGGVGCSTLAAATAVTAARAGLRPLLVDAHPGPAGVDLLLGEPEVPDHWSRFAGYRGHLPPQELATLPVLEGVRCLGWGGARHTPLWRSALSSVIGAGRADHELVVLDAGLDTSGATELPRLTRPILLVPGTWRGILAARSRLASLAGAFDEPVVIVLRDVGGRADPHGWEREFAEHPVVHLGFDASVIDDEDQGRPPGSRTRAGVARSSRRLLAVIADRAAAA
jgi:secretion/DNA translocation related CpaE-like protein